MKTIKDLMMEKRGISPVIATLFLMIISVTGGFITYTYVMGWIGGSTETPSGIKGQLQFDSLSANTNTITIYVRNVGHKILTVSTVYIEGVLKITLNLELSVGEISSIISLSHSMINGCFYEVKVACTDGTTISQSIQSKP